MAGMNENFWTNTIETLDWKMDGILKHWLNNKEVKYLDWFLNNNDDVIMAINISKEHLKSLQKELTLNFTTSFDDDIIHMKFRIDKILSVPESEKERIGEQIKQYDKQGNKQDKSKIKTKNTLSTDIEVKNSNDIKDFAAMVRAESLGEWNKWQRAVAYVIKNRMTSWNKTLKQVLYKKTRSWKAEFSPVDDWRLSKMKKQITSSDIKLVKEVLAGTVSNPIKNATFFQNKRIEQNSNTWQERAEKSWKLIKVATVWNHIFRAVA